VSQGPIEPIAGSCGLCGGPRFDAPFIAYDRVVARADDYVYARCRACGLVSLVPTPRDEDIDGFYPDEYEPHAPAAGSEGRPTLGFFGRQAARHRFTTSARRREDAMGRMLWAASGAAMRDTLDPRGANRMLDVGCGSGRLLSRHRDLGWEVRGIDPSARAVAACHDRGLPVQQAGLLEADLPSRHFDVVLLNHVIEHVPRPLEALGRARELLAPGGVIVVVTPNVGGAGFRLHGSCWYALDAPRHLHLFDSHALDELARRVGLVVEKTVSEASPRVLAASRHYARTQGPVLPPGLAARAAALSRSAEEEMGRGFVRAIRPAAHVLAWLGFGETLRAQLAHAPAPGEEVVR
jgi:2-polyprenyl-3-methyl-5-hydroxy-6-metoxy-1,4-benzoquinol methylase